MLRTELGVTPDAVASFSMGEPSGAVACGALSPTQGALVMSAMTDCVARAEGDGGMLAVIGLRGEVIRTTMFLGGTFLSLLRQCFWDLGRLLR